jgi:antitoxin MazE
MLAQIARWGNSQGIRIPKKLLENAGLELNDQVEIITKGDSLIIKPAAKKTIDWYLEGYERPDDDRYDWGESDEPRGREVLY